MIRKIEYITGKDGNGNVYGAIPSDTEIIAKINEVIDYINSQPEEKPSDDLEEVAEEYASDYPAYNDEQAIAKYAFKRGAEWQKEQMMDEWLKDRDGCFWDGVNEGKKAMEEQMMKDAVEGEIGYWNQRGLSIRLDQSLEKLGYGEDTEVKIIIVKR